MPGTMSEMPDDPEQTINTVWEATCTPDQKPGQTIKRDSPAAAPPRLTLVIKERILRTAEDRSAAEAEYELLKVLGEGGMGIVYDARQSSMDRRVAVKMLKPREGKEGKQRQKFLLEAVITADLDHPNIVPIYDLGSSEKGTPFYAMKRVRGTSWSELIKSKSLRENVEILVRVADAIAFAHARGVVHRDLKPENVMLGEFGEVLVMDWGLAHPTSGFARKGITGTSGMGGTPAYMAPELAIGPVSRIGPPSDVYLLGAILYEIITGRQPHRGKNVMDCLVAAAKNQIAPTEASGELLDISLKAMATDPEERYPSVREFQSAIREYESHSESGLFSARAEKQLGDARRTDEYQDYAKAVFAFEEARALWPGNTRAKAGLSEAKLAYAESATRRGDYDLASSLLDVAVPEHAKLHAHVEKARRERDTRQQGLKMRRIAMGVLCVAVGVLVLLGVVVTLWLRDNSLRVANFYTPSVYESSRALRSVQQSLGALRGWVILGNSSFKDERGDAWKSDIRPAVRRLAELAEQGASADNEELLAELAAVLNDLFEAQWWIEDVAQTPGNEPAHLQFLEQVEPVGDEISRAVASLMGLEKELPLNGERKLLLGLMADLRSSLAHAKERLASFLDDASEVHEEDFYRYLALAKEGMKAIGDRSHLLVDHQGKLLEWMEGELPVFDSLAREAIAIRKSASWNIAHQRLAGEALPLGRRASSLLARITRTSNDAMRENVSRVARISTAAAAVSLALAAGAFLVTWLISRSRAGGSRRFSGFRSSLLLIAALPAVHPAIIDAQDQKEPPDVYVLTRLVRSELGLIRLEMGKPEYGRSPLSVKNAAPHEVFFQALTLFRKVDRLCFEQLREHVALPEAPQGDIRPAHVYAVLDTVLDRLRRLKSRLGIVEESKKPARDLTKTPTDVFRSIVEANRQLNVLMEKRFSPSDVYQQVTLAVGYASRLLARFPETTRIPAAPPFERRKRPADVYFRLVDCFGRIRKIAERSGIQLLELNAEGAISEDVAPSDVYDIASLLVSELAYLHSRIKGSQTPREVFHPGKKFPAHVYQRAGLLEAQLIQLEGLVEKTPSWLSRPRTGP